MAQIKVKGEQLNIQDVASDIASDVTAIGSIATGVTTDPGATATLDADYLRRDGTGLMLADLDLGANNLVTTGTVDGRDVSVDGLAQDSHIGAANIHFTETSIDHANISSIGTISHNDIDTHINNVNIHRIINDSGTLVTELFSASEIITRLAGKSDTSHTHAIGALSDVSVGGAISGEALTFDGANWINSVVILTGSSVSVGGIDVFSAINGSDLEFNGVVAGPGGEISVTLDGGNNNVVIDANPVTIAAGIAFNDISDITLTAPAATSYLKYNGTTAWIDSDFSTDVITELNSNSIDELSDVDTTTSAPNLSEVLTWDGSNWSPAVNPSGVTTFVALTDTPNLYGTDQNQFVMVNPGATGLVFVPATIDNIFDVDTSTIAPTTNDGLVFDGANWTNQAIVNSFNGRTGAVSPVANDYNASDVSNTPTTGISATTVQAAIDELDTEKTTDVAVAVNHYTKTESDTITPAAGAKVDKVVGVSGNVVEFGASNVIADSGTATSSLAPLASPVFTGVPVLPKYLLTTLPPVVEGGMIFVTDANTGTGAMCYGQISGSPDLWIDVTTGIAVA